MNVKLLTEHHLEILRLKEAAQARLSQACQNATLLESTCHGSIIYDVNIRDFGMLYLHHQTT